MRIGLALFATCVLVCAAGARHDARADGPKKTPWSQGVSANHQKEALRIFQVGNKYFQQSNYTDAVAQYEKALVLWDHPNIRFNIAFCLINMRQPLLAYEHLKQSLRYGEAPLGKKIYADALTYMALLEDSLAELTVTTEQPAVKIMLDGKELFVGTNTQTTRLLAGRHQLVATRPGYTTDSRALDLPAGRLTKIEIALVPVEVKVVNTTEKINYERRWSWWVPWTIAGGGVALGLTGVGVYVSARKDMRSYDRQLAMACPVGCRDEDIPPNLSDLEDKASRKSAIAVGLWVAGGAVALTAGVMAILNRPRPMEERGVTPTVTVSKDFVGAGVSLSFE